MCLSPVGERSFKWQDRTSQCSESELVFAPCRGKVFQITRPKLYGRSLMGICFRPLSGKGLSNDKLQKILEAPESAFSPPVGERSFKWLLFGGGIPDSNIVFAPCRGKVFQIKIFVRQATTEEFVFAPCRGKVFQINRRKKEMTKNQMSFRPLSGKGLSNVSNTP